MVLCLTCVAHLVEHPISILQIISISIASKNCSPVLNCFCLTISINYINPSFQKKIYILRIKKSV